MLENDNILGEIVITAVGFFKKSSSPPLDLWLNFLPSALGTQVMTRTTEVAAQVYTHDRLIRDSCY
jgi:hypothetical protein